MKLTGRQVQQIRDALLDAYATPDALRMMVRIELNENLAAIAGGENLRVMTFNLVSWAEQHGQVNALLAGARNQAPGNPALQQLSSEWNAEARANEEPSPALSPAGSSGPASIDLFLSYSREDSDTMHEVLEPLHEAGLSVWTDKGLEPGTDSWQDAVAEALNQAKAMVVLLSPNANSSTWVKREIGFAQARDKRVFPILISGDETASVPLALIDAQRVDGRADPSQAVVQDLLPALSRYLAYAQSSPPRRDPADGTAEAALTGELTSDAPQRGVTPRNAQRKRANVWYTVGVSVLAVIVVVAGLLLISRLLSLGPAALDEVPIDESPAPETAAATETAAETNGPTSEMIIYTVQPGDTLVIIADRFQTTVQILRTSNSLAGDTLYVGQHLVVPTVPGTTGEDGPTATPSELTTRQPTPDATRTSTPAAGEVRINPKDGAEYVYVPAGRYTIGSRQADAAAVNNEKPQAAVDLGGFWIMRTEVTNAQYRRCVGDNQACKEPHNHRWNDPVYANHPVTDVNWQQASDYAAWAGGRLPTEAEWESACRGSEERTYPWGNLPPTPDLANYGRSAGNTTSVGTYSPQGDSQYGLVDMAGNVWEWTSSQYMAYPYRLTDGRENPEGPADRTLRGGGWNFDSGMRCAFRNNYSPGRWNIGVGFRIISTGF